MSLTREGGCYSSRSSRLLENVQAKQHSYKWRLALNKDSKKSADVERIFRPQVKNPQGNYGKY
jgi:hypothetical protein